MAPMLDSLHQRDQFKLIRHKLGVLWRHQLAEERHDARGLM
jgi:hypothetical protein